jgi:hypothetical protein
VSALERPSVDSVASEQPEDDAPRDSAGRPRRDDWQDTFLQAFSLVGIATEACRNANVSTMTLSRERKRNPDFEERYQQAKVEADGVLERFLHERATSGQAVTKTVTKTGPDGAVETTVTEMRHISTPALIALLKARLPERYRERLDHRHTGGDGGPVLVEGVYRQPTRERMLELAKMARELEADTIDGTATEEQEEGNDDDAATTV